MNTKEIGIAYLLWFFLGALGGHRFYVGDKGLGVLYLLTLGLFGVGVIVDLFVLPSRVRRYNAAVTA